MTKQFRFIDAFKVNEAPYFLEDLMYGGERKVYLAEAYTDLYMIRSDKTGRLCRYLVNVEGQMISAYQHFGVRPSKCERKNLIAMLKKMTVEQKIAFIQSSFDVRFKSFKEWDEYFFGTKEKAARWSYFSLEDILRTVCCNSLEIALVVKN